MLPKGGLLGEDGRLRFPRALVEDAIAKTPKSYILHAPDPALDMEVKNQEVILTTSGEPVKILDYKSQTFRDPTLAPLDLHYGNGNGDGGAAMDVSQRSNRLNKLETSLAMQSPIRQSNQCEIPWK